MTRHTCLKKDVTPRCQHRSKQKQRRVRIQLEPTHIILRSNCCCYKSKTCCCSGQLEQPIQIQQDDSFYEDQQDSLWLTRLNLAKMKRAAKKQGPTPYANLLIKVYQKVCQSTPTVTTVARGHERGGNSNLSSFQDAKSMLLDFYCDTSKCCFTVENPQLQLSSLSIISSQRGLEMWSSPVHAIQRSACVVRTRLAVLTEQTRQRNVATAKCSQSISTSDDAGSNTTHCHDDDLLRQVSEALSRSARIFAQLLGQTDAAIAQNI